MRALPCHFSRTLSRYYCIPVSEIRAVLFFLELIVAIFSLQLFLSGEIFRNTDSQVHTSSLPSF
jgi:hypothetical protein